MIGGKEMLIMDYNRYTDDMSKVAEWMEWVENGTASVPKVLYECFRCLGSGTAMKSAHDNGIELVQFASSYAKRANDIPNPNAPARVNFLRWLDSLANELSSIAKKNESCEIESEAHWARELYQSARTDFTALRYCNIYDLILNNWDVLKGWQVTYNVLQNLVCVQADWISIEDAREELTSIIMEMANEW